MNDLILNIIEEARRRESSQDIFLLEKDEVTQELILAWEKMGVVKFDEKVQPMSENVVAWERLWHGAKLDLNHIASLANIPRSMIQKHLEFAQRNFFIYPDGTCHKHALALAKKTKLLRLREKGLA